MVAARVVGVYGASGTVIFGAVERVHVEASLRHWAVLAVRQVLRVADEVLQVPLWSHDRDVMGAVR